MKQATRSAYILFLALAIVLSVATQPRALARDDASSTLALSSAWENDLAIEALNLDSTSVSIASSPNPSSFGQPVTFTAHATSVSQPPTGSFSFFDGATSLGTVALSGDSAQLGTAALAVGSHAVKAVYSGDVNFRSDSASMTQTVNQAAPTVSIVSSLNPSTFQQSVTFTAHVTGGSQTPTGSVTFFDGVTSLATFALSGDSARLSTATLTAGSHPIKAVYSGDGNFKSDSASVTQTVNKAAPTVSIVSSLNPSTFQQSVTFTAHVTGGSQTPTGSVTFFDGASSLGTFALSADSARLSTATLTAGSHPIKAVYSGDVNFRSDSASMTQTVSQAAPTVSIVSSLNPSTFQQSVTFTAHVTGGSQTPTGSVTFFDGASSLGTFALSADSARLTTGTLTAGSHPIKAVYGGDASFNRDSASVTQTVNTAAPAVSIASSLNPSTYQQNVTFTAHVTGGSQTPTGSVSFFNATALLGTVALTGDSARLTTGALTAGSHVVKAVYGGDGNFRSDSAALTQTVNQASPAVSIVSSSNPSTFQQTVTFTARVTGSSLTPTGSVTFFNGASSLGTVALTGDSARLSTSVLTAGSHLVKSVYAGDGNFKPDSASLTQNVNQAGPTVTITSSSNPSTFQQSVTFTAHVDGAGGTPTGGVTFFDGTTTLASVALTGDSARFSTSSFTAGSHPIKVIYGGDANFTVDSASLTQTVNPAAPTVSIGSSLNPSTFQQSVTFTAHVTGGSQTPTGSVTFFDGAGSLGTFALTGDSARITTAALTAGSHPIKAVYGGDANFRRDSASVTQTVNSASATVSLASSLNPSTFQQSVTFSAHIAGGSQTPTGSVTFVDGAATLATVSLTADSARFSTAALTGGSHSIKAVYSGDANFKRDSASITQTVNAAAATVSLASSLNPSTFLQSVTFTAHVAGSSQTPTGSVTFFDGAGSLGTVALAGDSARLTTAALTAGSHAVKAVYGGDGNFRSDSASVTQSVNQAAPTVSIASSLNPSTFQQSVTFTAHVAGGSQTPTGSVTFFNGATPLGTVPLTGDSARLSSAALTAGGHVIKAVYGGDGNFKSDSASMVQGVNQAAPAVSIAASPNPSTFQQSVTFTAHVTGGSQTPTGSVTFFNGTGSLGTVALTGDSARLSTAALTTGSHVVKAIYGGDGNFRSDSASVTQTVNASSTTVTLVSSVNPSTFQQSVSFTARVAGGSQTPTGSVAFFDGAASLGTIALAGDSARFTTSTLTVGAHPIKAVYGGDVNFNRDSASVTQTVNQASPAVSIASSLNPSTFQQSVTFTAHVTGGSQTPTGNVTFFDGAGSLGTVALTGDSARLSTAALTAGSHAVKAVYGGDGSFRSDSASVTQTVNAATSTVSLASSLNPSTFQQSVSFTAHVAGGTQTPTGSVTFFDGATTLGTVALSADSARLSTAALIAGSHVVKAVYGGDGNFKSDSASVTQVVNAASPAVTLTSSLNPSTFQQNVSFTAHVAGGSQTPTGSMTFFDGATSLGTVALSADSARLSTSALAAGSHPIKAVYGGDANFNRDSASVTQTVNQAAPAVSIASSLNPSTFQQSVTFTAHVTGGSRTPTGSVSFFDGAASLGTIALSGDSARLSTSALAAGGHPIKAVYGGDANFTRDSASVTQTVIAASSSVTLTSSLNPSTFQQSVTFTARVAGGSQTPTGSIAFFDGATSLGTVALSADSARLSTAALNAGSHPIKAVYGGDANFNRDSALVTQTVNQAAPAVSIASSLNPSTFQQSVTFTAHVTGGTQTPTGSVTFFNGTGSLGTVALTGDSARLSTAALTAGSHAVKVVYGGDGNFRSDSATVTQTVNAASSTLSLASSLNPSTFQQSVSFTAHVAGGTQTPTGSITFFDGATSLGTVALSADSARFTTAALTAGSHPIKAVYGGDANFNRDSATVAQTVNAAASTVSIASSLNPSTFQQSVTFTAHVTGGTQTPTGGVSFFDGAASLGTVALTADSARLTTSALTAGSHPIKAVYGGDANFNRDSASVTQTVNAASSSVTLTSSLNPSTFQQSVSFTAHVAGGSQTPTGSVTFYDGATSLGSVALSADSARFTTAALTAGSHPIKAVYGGDANFNRDSGSVTQSVNQAGPAVSVASSPNPSTFQQSVTFTAHVTGGTQTPTGSVTFFNGAGSLGTVALTGDSARFTTATLSAGSHVVKAVYGGDGNFRSDSATVTQTVNAASSAVTLASSLNPSTFQQSVSFTAHVAGGSQTPTGSVAFFDGATPLGTVALAGDSARLSTAALTAGSHPIKAVYSGDANFNRDSASVAQTVNAAAPAVSIASSLNPSTFQQSVTFTAHVTGGTQTPTGSVSFFDGAGPLGTVALAGDSARLTTAALAAGSHPVKAVYLGDGNFRSDSASITQSVNIASSSVALTSSLNPSTFEQSVTFTAHVSGGSQTPTGSVTFFDGAASLGTVALTGDSARLTTAALTAGSHPVKALYGGDGNFNPDSASITQTVNQASPAVTLASSLNPSTFQQSVTFTAHVRNSSHTPTGSVTFFDGAGSLGTVPLSGDSAQLTTAALTAGSHPIKSVYSGDANFRPDSASLTQGVNIASSAVSLVSSLNPSTFQQSVTFTARVSGGSQTPTGSVAFFDGAASLGTVALSGDSARISTAALAAGSHQIKAVYGGDANFGSDSATVTQSVNIASSTLSLNSSLNPSVFEQSVTFTAHVAGGSQTPTGIVTFFDGAVSLGATALAGDSARLATAALTAGSHTIKAVYGGDANFSRDSSTVVQTVNQASPTVTLSSGLNPSVYQQSVTFTAHVRNSSHTPTGTVAFYDGTSLLGAIAMAGDSARLTTAALTAGSHAIKAVYGGDGNFKSDSASVPQVVTIAASTAALASSLNPSTFQQSVTFTAHVTGGTQTPTGSVTFFDGAISLGTIALAGDSAQLATSALTAGSHAIKAVYGGDANFARDSASVTQLVNTASSTLALSSSLNPSIFEQNVTFTAHVTGASQTPTGSVTFYDGASLLGTITLSGGNALLSTAALAVGSHAIKAVYGGDANFFPDSSSLSQGVNQAVPVVSLLSSLNPSVFQQSVTFTARVTNSTHTPTGTISFYDGASLLGTIALAGDSARFSTAGFSSGSHAVKAVYSGDVSFKPDSASITQIVSSASATVALASSLNPSTFEQNVTFTAHVAGGTQTPTGSISFFDGLSSLGIVPLHADSATLSTPALTAGSHTIKAVYGGDANFSADSALLAQTVNKALPAVAFTSSLNPSTFGQPVTFKAHVTNSTHVPTGSVTFVDGAATLATVPLAGDSAQFTTAVLTAGSHAIRAVYGGDANFRSDSASVTQVVNTSSSAVALASSLNPSTFEQSVTFTARVSGGSQTPTGSVSFYDGASALGTVPLAGDSARLSTAALAAGSHAIKAVYGGDGNFNSDSTTIVQTVNTALPTISLASSLSPSLFEQNVTFTTRVRNSTHTPTGTVSYFDGVALLAAVSLAGDSAQFSTTNLAAGSHLIRSVYSGDSNFKPDSTSISQVVNQASPAVTLTSSLNPSAYQQSVTFTAHVRGTSHTPSGGVSFYDGATLLASLSLTGDSAQVTSATLIAGSHLMRIVYAGDANFKADSASMTQVVNQGAPAVALTSSLNPSVYQQTVTFKARVAGTNRTPTGSVSFYDGASPLGTFALAGDSAQVSTAALTAGTHTIKAVYGGDSNFRPDSASMTQTVNAGASTVVILSSLNPSTYAQNVTFTAHVSGGSQTPTGSVTFYDGVAALGAVALSGDSARLSTALLTAGSHAMKAVYSGDANFRGDSASVTQIVNKAAAAVSLASSLNPSAFGQSVTFKAHVTNASQTPTGTVAFYDAALLLGLLPLSGDSAQFATAALSGGSHAIKAVYSGDGNFGADSASLSQVVNPATPTVTIASSLNPSTFSQGVTFSAHVRSAVGTPSGSVSFLDGSTLLTVVALTGDSARFTTSTLGGGSHTVKAVYSGDASFRVDSASLTQVVIKTRASVTLAANPNPSSFGQNVVFTVHVNAGALIATGSVTFFDGGTPIGAVALIGDSALVATAAFAAGTHTVKAVYSGDGNFAADSASLTQTVNRLRPTSILTTSPNPSSFGQSVTLRDALIGPPPAGSMIIFREDGITFDSAAVNGSGIAILSLTTLSAGTHTLTAFYPGNANFDSSTSNAVIQLVRPDSLNILAIAQAHGTVTPSGTVSVARGDRQRFVFTSSTYYRVDSLFIDGAFVDSTAGYTFVNVQTNHLLVVKFRPITFTITASAGPNGTITPSGAVSVDAGSSPAFAITGDRGYKVADVVVDGVSVGSPTRYVFNVVAGNHTIAATFAVSTAYDAVYRSFDPDSIALSKDNKGKPGKPVSRTPTSVEFHFTVTNDSAGVNGLHVELGVPADTAEVFATIPPSTRRTSDPFLRKWDFTFAAPLSPGDIVRVYGIGTKGVPQKVTRYYWTRAGVQVVESAPDPQFVMNLPELPMPNRINVLADAFAYSGFAATHGFLVGKDRSLDSARAYGWLNAPKYTNILMTLGSGTALQKGAPHGFDRYTSSRPVVNRQKQLAPSVYNSSLLAGMIALRLNIVASQLNFTPVGFGEIIYNDGTANPLNGMMIKEIAHYGDSVMMGYYSIGVHRFFSAAIYRNLDSTIRKINGAFEGPIDTVKFADTLRIAGTRDLASIPFLRSNEGAVPSQLDPVYIGPSVPDGYELSQNYPNPFNPATTIEFSLANPALVTLKVYNMLGQEVATLIDGALLAGDQSYRFDASNLATGVYIYRMVANQVASEGEGIPAGRFVLTKKMMLVK